MADERTEREQRDEEAEAALASAGAAAAPAAAEQEDAPEERSPEGDAPGHLQPEEGAPVEGEVPPGDESAAGEPPHEGVAGEDLAAATAALDDPAPQDDDRAAQYLALAQRTQADFENFRRRATRERGEAEARGVGRLARELLPALDNLERALAATEAQDTELTKGVRLVQGELAAALRRAGIEAYTPKGEPFDPNVHEAMAEHSVEGAASGTVVEVYQPGYRLADTVLRPARVVVAA
ncbi:MAG: nucleotide exchange factor GrpE [Solirubrobacteraceae bacterium MAG38_C4-C5]|nr:nucleotide exchange factor GrpE [Candidatus Siliceabacter maunaloa]